MLTKIPLGGLYHHIKSAFKIVISIYEVKFDYVNDFSNIDYSQIEYP
jgi:hypothetical protein